MALYGEEGMGRCAESGQWSRLKGERGKARNKGKSLEIRVTTQS
jgi:hypothetical protein